MKLQRIILIIFVVLCTVKAFGFTRLILKEVNTGFMENEYFTLECESNQNYSEIWLRKNPNACSIGDKKLGTINVGFQNSDQVKHLICRSKRIFDDGKTILGCTATLGTGVCVVTGGGAGVGTAACAIVTLYTVNTGFVDCISGLSGEIGKLTGQQGVSETLQITMNQASLAGLVSSAIDAACEDVP